MAKSSALVNPSQRASATSPVAADRQRHLQEPKDRRAYSAPHDGLLGQLFGTEDDTPTRTGVSRKQDGD
jgi:hypothetical protein